MNTFLKIKKKTLKMWEFPFRSISLNLPENGNKKKIFYFSKEKENSTILFRSFNNCEDSFPFFIQNFKFYWEISTEKNVIKKKKKKGPLSRCLNKIFKKKGRKKHQVAFKFKKKKKKIFHLQGKKGWDKNFPLFYSIDFENIISLNYIIFQQNFFKIIYENLILEKLNFFNQEKNQIYKFFFSKKDFSALKRKNQNLGWMKEYQKLCFPFVLNTWEIGLWDKFLEKPVPFHKNFSSLHLFRVVAELKKELCRLKAKISIHISSGYFSSFSGKFKKKFIHETKKIFEFRGILNRLISEKPFFSISLREFKLNSLKFLILEISAKIQRDCENLEMYILAFYNFWENLEQFKEITQNFLNIIMEKKSQEKIKNLQCPEWDFQNESKAIFLAFSRVKFYKQLFIFRNKTLEIFVSQNPFFKFFVFFPESFQIPLSWIKTSNWFMNKPLFLFNGTSIKFFCGFLDFFTNEEFLIGNSFFGYLFTKFLIRLKKENSSFRIFLMLSQIKENMEKN